MYNTSIDPLVDFLLKGTDMEIKPSEALQRVKNRIDTWDKWTQGHYARDGNQNWTSALSETATCWCTVGALRVESYVAARASEEFPMQQCRRYIEHAIGLDETIPTIPQFNDTTTHSELMSVLTNAINKAKEDENEAE